MSSLLFCNQTHAMGLYSGRVAGDIGLYTNCVELTNSGSSSSSGIVTKFCTVFSPATPSTVASAVGLCVPSDCPPSDIVQFVSQTNPDLASSYAALQNYTMSQLSSYVFCSNQEANLDQENNQQFSTSDAVLIGILGSWVVLVVLATVYDYFHGVTLAAEPWMRVRRNSEGNVVQVLQPPTTLRGPLRAAAARKPPKATSLSSAHQDSETSSHESMSESTGPASQQQQQYRGAGLLDSGAITGEGTMAAGAAETGGGASSPSPKRAEGVAAADGGGGGMPVRVIDVAVGSHAAAAPPSLMVSEESDDNNNNNNHNLDENISAQQQQPKRAKKTRAQHNRVSSRSSTAHHHHLGSSLLLGRADSDDDIGDDIKYSLAAGTRSGAIQAQQQQSLTAASSSSRQYGSTSQAGHNETNHPTRPSDPPYHQSNQTIISVPSSASSRQPRRHEDPTTDTSDADAYQNHRHHRNDNQQQQQRSSESPQPHSQRSAVQTLTAFLRRSVATDSSRPSSPRDHPISSSTSPYPPHHYHHQQGYRSMGDDSDGGGGGMRSMRSSWMPEAIRERRDALKQFIDETMDQLPDLPNLPNFHSVVVRAVLCLSLTNSFRKWRYFPESQASINIFNSLRVLAWLWIVNVDTFEYTLHVPTYATRVEQSANAIYAVVQRQGSAGFAIATFLIISGFTTMHRLTNMDARPMSPEATVMAMKRTTLGRVWAAVWWYIRFAVSRMVRVLPLYCCIVFLLLPMLARAGNGPFWTTFSSAPEIRGNCAAHWWANVLLINNFYPRDPLDRCFPWSYFIALDFQFVLLSPFVHYFFHKAGYRLFLVAVTLLTVGCLVLRYFYQPVGNCDASYPPTRIAFDAGAVYEQPHLMIVPFLAGAALYYAYNAVLKRKENMKLLGDEVSLLVMRHEQRVDLADRASFWLLLRLKSKPFRVVSIWSGLGLILFCILSSWQLFADRRCNDSVLAKVFTAISIVPWCIGICLTILPMLFGFGGNVRTFLIHRLWCGASRLVLAGYLLHPVVISFCNANAYGRSSMEVLLYIVETWGNIWVSLLVAFCFHLWIEQPSMHLGA